jgi:hypothetical protein
VAPAQPKKKPADTVKAVLNFEDEIKRKQAEAAKKRELWSALNHFCRSNNRGWLTSPPGTSIRIECPPDSELPDLLVDRGFTLQPLGSGSRIEAGVIRPVLIFALQLPSLRK